MAKNKKGKLLEVFKQKYFWILAILIAVPACLSLFHKGFFPTHDYIYVARIQQMFNALGDLQFPVRWVSGFRYGEPLYNFYAPLPYYLGALVHFFGFGYLTTAKILYGLSFALSGLAMFFCARKFIGNWASLAVSALYVYAPYRAVDVYVRGAMSEAFTFVFFPLIILFAYNLYSKFSKREFVLLALSLAGLFLTHNILTMLFLPFFLILIAFWWLKNKDWLFVKRVGIALLAGVGISAFYLFPAFLEKGFIQTQNLTDQYFNYLGHFVALKQFIIPSWGYGASLWGPVDDMSFQVGLVHWGVFLIALLLVLKNFKKVKNDFMGNWFGASLFLFFLSLFFQHNKSTFIWLWFPFLGFVQFPWRFLALSVLFITLLAIPAFKLISSKFLNIFSLLVIILVISVNVGYFRPDMYYEDSIDEHYVGKEALSTDSKLPKDYLAIWVKTIKEEKISEPVILTGKGIISDYSQKGTRISLRIVSEGELLVQVPVTYFPGWKAKVNGEKVMVKPGDEMGLIAFDIGAGENEVKIWFGDTPIRLVSNLVSLASIALIGIYWVNKKGKCFLTKFI